MNNGPELGMNRTGIATSPDLSARMVEGTAEFQTLVNGDDSQSALVRQEYSKDAEPLGSIPPPTRLGATIKTAVKRVMGKEPVQFLDKLGERLAFERSGVRLYSAVLTKLDAHGSFAGGPTREALAEMMAEEHQHFEMLTAAITKLGGDPTVITPSADFHSTLTKGVFEAVGDPRSSLVQCLEALLLVELADNACWATLTQLAQRSGEESLVSQFEIARVEEEEHLLIVRSWLLAAQQPQDEAVE